MKKCPNCGEPLNKKAKFCRNCGSEVKKQKGGRGLLIIIALSALLVIGILAFFIFDFFKTEEKPKTEPSVSAQASEPSPTSSAAPTPVVSPTPPPVPTVQRVVKDISPATTNGSLSVQNAGLSLGATASSVLPDQLDNTYLASNVLDGNPSTAWVEGAEGNGTGETITLTLSGDKSGELTGVEIMNGYCKSQTTFSNNACPRILEMSVDGEIWYRLTLERQMGVQKFQFPEALKTLPEEITFKILEVYEGQKYSDTAISEIRLLKSEN